MTSLDDLDLWPPPDPAVMERELWQRHVGRVVRGSGCWEWTGTRDSKGYGRITIRKRDIPAHRALYSDYLGRPLGRWELVLHRCGNPPCVRPDHLYIGTQADNARDREVQGRTSRGEAHARRCNPHAGAQTLARLTADQVREIRSRSTGRFGEQRELATEFGVDPSVISKILNGHRWTHV